MAGDLITTDGQVEWRGTLLGAASPFRMTRLEGWLDLADTRVQDVERPGRHGLFQGRQLMGKRLITFSYLVKGVSADEFGAAIRRLRRVTAPAEAPAEEPLVIRLDGETWQANARCVRRSIDVRRFYAVGFTTGAIQWQATDPRLYSLVQRTAVTGLAAPPTDGLPFPLVFDLKFGEGPRGGRFVVTNEGDVAAWPVWEVTGPVVGPAITNQVTGQRLQFEPDFRVAEGQRLVVDTDARTVRLGGVNRNDALVNRQWFPIPAGGDVQVAFTARSYDPTASLTARWRDATI